MPDQNLQRLVAANAPTRAEEILRPLIELLGAARESFGGDADKFLILLIVAIRAAGHKSFAKAAMEFRASGEVPNVFPTLGVNIQSVADSIGAPKETVRRKVADMVETGWIERREHQLHMTVKAYAALKPIRELIYALVARNYETVHDLLAEGSQGQGEG